jgi:hypothetical protein
MQEDFLALPFYAVLFYLIHNIFDVSMNALHLLVQKSTPA